MGKPCVELAILFGQLTLGLLYGDFASGLVTGTSSRTVKGWFGRTAGVSVSFPPVKRGFGRTAVSLGFDDICIGCFWWTVKREYVYLNPQNNVVALPRGIAGFMAQSKIITTFVSTSKT